MQDFHYGRVIPRLQKHSTSMPVTCPFYLRLLTLTFGLFLLTSLLANTAHAQVALLASAPLPDLPSSWENVGLAAMSGSYQPVNGLDATPLINYVMWGASPTTYLPSVANHARYCKFGQNNHGGQSDNEWLMQNHPDWIAYQSDKKTPAYYTVGSTVDKDHMPLDMANPSVQDFVAQQCALPAIAEGFNAVGFDHANTLDVFGVAGHYDTSGHWIKQYSGAQNDPTYRSATIAAFARLMAKVRAVGVAQGHPLYIAANDYPNLSNNANWFDLLPYIDVVFDEAGFTKMGDSKAPYLMSIAVPGTAITNAWYTKVQDLQYLQDTLGKAVIINGLEHYQIDANHLPHQNDIQWVLANYLMVKSQYTYQAFMGSTGPDYHHLNVTLQEYFAQVGHPLDEVYQSQNVYMRDYSHGLTVVNPSSCHTYTVTLPAGTYVDLYGNPVTTVTMQAHSGMVLVKI